MPIRSDTLDSFDDPDDRYDKGVPYHESSVDDWEYGPMNDEDYDEFDQEHDEVDVYYADEDW